MLINSTTTTFTTTSPPPLSVLHLPVPSPSIQIHIQSTPKSIYPIDKNSISIYLRLRSKPTHFASIHVIYMNQHVITLNIQPSILPPFDRRPPAWFPRPYIYTIVHPYTQYHPSKS